jgi:tetratricopeptide (TPR) repeat protein
MPTAPSLTRHAEISHAGLLLAACLTACTPKQAIPDPASQQAGEASSAFYSGLAAFEVGDDVQADTRLEQLTRLAPGEPAGWADWGLLALRQGKLDLAAQRIGEASKLAPGNEQMWVLIGIVQSRQGRSAEAIDAYKRALALAPADLRTAYLLSQEIERQGAPNSDVESQRVVAALLAQRPDNLAVLLEMARLAARRGEGQVLHSALDRIGRDSAAWPAEVKEVLADVQGLAAKGDFRGAATRMIRLRNALGRVAEYRDDLAAIKAPAGADALVVRRPLRLAAASPARALADSKLRFDLSPASAGGGEHKPSWVGAVRLDDIAKPVFGEADGVELRLDNGRIRLPFPGGAGHVPPTPEGILQLDFSYDFKTDLALAGAGGVRLFRQVEGAAFVDVTKSSGLPAATLDANYTGAWAADIDQDGDLDIVLGSAREEPVVLRNNGDGSFTPIKPFPGISGIRQFAWLDLDGDGVCDVALIDGAGHLRFFMNRRQGQFAERAAPEGLGDVKAIAIGEANRLAGFALMAVLASGAVVRISDTGADAKWDVSTSAQVPNAASLLAADVRLLAADLDNNGIVDWILSRASPEPDASATNAIIWLGQPDGSYSLLAPAPGLGAVLDAADMSGSGHLDLLTVSSAGQAAVAVNRPSLAYHWQTIRPRAAQSFGDQRINPFGVGGAVEIRVGTQTQMRPITGPVVHFGLGDRLQADIVRVLWPNGVIQAEFDVAADQSIAAEQRLKGSCPFMFAFDGKTMSFVKDTVPWSSAIGLRINTLGSAAIAATEEWYKIPGPQLVAHDGYYDIRITGELWEVYYYDQLSLTGVDHPAGTEIFVDERFAIPPVRPAITVVETPRPIQSAYDDDRRDVTATLRDLDGVQVDGFGHGQYQGVTKDHYVELDLGDAARVDGKLYLIAQGSLRPTDSSINVALSQGKKWLPRGLSLEVPDGRGGWKVANDNLGFPAGRKKTILVELTDAFVPGTTRRVRLRTNLEIYWDKIEWARALPDVGVRTFLLPTLSADLHYRGYSALSAPPAGAPEIPDYNRLVGTRQRWRDLTGFFTRYGDVRELLDAPDDRYVIMNAGDEMSLRFSEASPPAPGWVRDFVIKGDGWIKDGDYNSTFSKTVQPLPHHGEKNYDVAPGRLEDEWAYRQHPEDWLTYQTRYIEPAVIGHASATDQP